MFDYQLDFKDPLQKVASEEAYRQLTDPLKLTRWCQETQQMKELMHASTDPAEREMYHKNAALAKSHLPKFTWQASFPGGKRKKDEAIANGLFIYDWDGIYDKPVETVVQELLERYKNKGSDFIQEEGVMVIHYTPSRHGIRLVCKADESLDIAGNQAQLAERMGVPEDQRDTSVKDLSRVSYGVPCNEEWTVYLDPAVFTYFNPVYSLKYSTLHKGTLHKGTGALCNSTQDSSAGSLDLEGDLHNAPVPLCKLTYSGMPYSQIISKWWELYNEGKEPMVSNRNTLIFELACNLRHICGFDRNLLDQVIPNYDSFPEEEKLSCIDNALKERRGRMPARLQHVLNTIKMAHTDNPEIIQAMDEAEEEDEMYYLKRMQALPLGVRDSLEGIKPTLGMPVLIAIGPAIGALATGVRLSEHGEFVHLNMQAYIVGEAGSDKGKMGPIFDNWVWKILEEDKIGHKIEEEYEEQCRLAKNNKQQPKNPHPPIRYQSLRTSNAMLLYRLKYSGGKHLVSFTSESDLFSQNAKQSWADTSVLVRLAYDGDRYSSDYKSDSAVNGVIDEVLWNMTLCCTPDALYRSVRNYTNGEVTRLSIAATPDNTFTPFVQYSGRSQEAREHISQVGELLMLMQGDVELPLLETACTDWLERIRMQKLKDDDRTGAQLRVRTAKTAMRYTCCLMLCAFVEWLLEQLDHKKGAKAKWTHGCKTAKEYLSTHPGAVVEHLPQFQTPEMMNNYAVLADYIQDNLEFFFKERIERAKSNGNYAQERQRQAGNDTIFNRLPETFTIEHVQTERGASVNRNTIRMMLKNWKRQGLIDSSEKGIYVKIGNTPLGSKG